MVEVVNESQVLADAVAAVWPEEPGSDATAIEADLIDALRALDAADGPESAEDAQDQVLAVLDRVPELRREVEKAISVTLLSAERGVEPTAPTTPARQRCSEIEILYATDRLPSAKRGEIYGSRRDQTLHVGRAWVSVPDDHKTGRLPQLVRGRLKFLRPGDLRLRTKEAPELSLTVTEMRARMPVPDMLVFVHGYNVSFVDAARRTAQLAHDLSFPGMPVLYSWPSAGNTLAYVADGAAAEATQHRFRNFLDTLTQTAAEDGGKAHVIAHSMGNRILTEALCRPPGYALGQVVFAAPDLDAEQFRNRVADFSGTAERYTLYVNDGDRALAVSGSAALANAPRAGRGGSDVLVLDGVDTVDTSRIISGLMRHSYAMGNRNLVSDLYLLIHHNHRPDERPGLEAVVSPDGLYWMFRR